MMNFARFYGLLNALPYEGEREEMKRQLVLQYTNGRTEHVHEMSRQEYDSCCAALEELTGRRALQRKWRSKVLGQMQRMGVDTSDWARVDNFCRNPRIAGKVFARLSVGELQDLSRKLYAIAGSAPLNPPCRGREDCSDSGGRLTMSVLAMPMVMNNEKLKMKN